MSFFATRPTVLSPARSQNRTVRTVLSAVCGLLLSIPAANLWAQSDSSGNRISLWNGTAPVDREGHTAAEDAWITVHSPSQGGNGDAIVICPGGGYGGLVTGPEGHGIAQWLNQHGITGIVLEYRLPKGRQEVPLLDAQRALRTARSRASEWKIKADRIGIMGFSAGGHLASTAGTHFDAGNAKSEDPVERVSCRPDFMILIYPVITLGEGTHSGSKKNLLGDNPDPTSVNRFSNELQVTSDTPPAFLAHAQDDRPVPPKHSELFRDAMVSKQVRCEYLALPRGGHGLDGYKGPMWDAWQTQSMAWLKQLK